MNHDAIITDPGPGLTERDLIEHKPQKLDIESITISVSENTDEFHYTPNQKETLVEIINLGIQLESALFLLKLSPDIKNFQSAFEIITTDDSNTMNHPYIDVTFKKGRCGLCEMTEQIHCKKYSDSEREHYSKVFERIVEFLSDSKKREELLKDIKTMTAKKNCDICFADTFVHNIFHMNEVSHEICIPCLKEYLTQDIIIGKVVEMKCPHCLIPLPEQEIQKHVDPTTYAKFVKFLNQNRVNTDPLSRWCPNPSCSQVVRLANKNDSKATCGSCGMMICALCNREAHSPNSCSDVLNKELKDWSSHRDVSRCPKCRVLVEKETGCNHMNCQICAYEWCWLCGAAYTSIHYLPMNPLGCPGLQSGGFKANRWGCGRICLWRILVLLLILMALPIYLAIGPSLIFIFVILDSNWWRRKFRNRRKCRKCSGVLLVLFLTLLLTPLLIAINLIAILPMLIIALGMYIKERRKMSLRSKQKMASFKQANARESV